MPHNYASLQLLTDPGYLGSGIIDQKYGTTLLRMLENASEEIDHITFRHFHVKEGIYYFDGSGAMFIPNEDILSITTLLLDPDGSQNFSTTLGPTEYAKYPLNSFPKLYLKMTQLSTQGGFAAGIKSGVKITGTFGHGDGESATPYYDSGVTVTVATTTGTTITLSAEGTLQQGHTIRVESEQMYVKDISINGNLTATVERGVNGTMAATHSAKAAYIYKYPGPITEATLILATAWWKQRENPATYMAGDNITGSYTISKDIEKIVKNRVEHHIKRQLR